MLLLRGIQKSISGISVLHSISLEVKRGEIVVVRGRSGVGKTTLAKIAALIMAPDSGEVVFMGRNAAKLSERERSRLRLLYIGYVDQFFRLIPELNLWENVELPLKLLGIARKEREKRVEEMLKKLGLLDKAKQYPTELSGGERQRAAIARALVKNPLLVVGDEPFSSLDDETIRIVVGLFKSIAKSRGTSFLITTTDLYRDLGADRDFVLKDGILIEFSSCRD